MWFTRLSINNPVLATMVMLALVVLGLFSYQRLKVDQFPDIELPTLAIQLDYPGASPEIIESEVTRKVEEAVNTVAGINQLYSRSYEGSSVVIVQFNLDVDGRRAADDVREKLSAIRPTLRDEVKEPRVLRFDPANRPIFSLALTSPDTTQSEQALSTYADQILRKRLENVRGVGSVNLVGALKRQINVYLKPQALQALGLRAEQVANAVRLENQDQPAGSVRTKDQDRVVQIDARLKTVRDFERLIITTRANQPIRLSQVADVIDGPQELDTLALYNGKRTLALEVLKAQGENTLDVAKGLREVVTQVQQELPPGMKVDIIRDNSRPIAVSVSTVRETLIEGALLTVGIVFLFLNSWRSTVITGLTLPISIIGTFLFMYAFGFSINMITLMALSLCVGLLIDDAIVVRENIVRHVQMGKSALDSSLDGTKEIGLAVLATTLSIVAVFLPIGFMGGIIGKFFHEFGITIVAAVMISMFVSFTLDPMLSSIWHDPAIHRQGEAGGSRSLYDRSIGRVTAAIEHWADSLGEAYQHILSWALDHPWWTMLLAAGSLVGSLALMPLMGTEFVPKADYSETFVNFYTPAGTSLEATEARTHDVEALIRNMPEVSYTLSTINTGFALGRNQVSIYVRLKDRHQRQRSVDQLSAPLRQALSQLPDITVTHVGLLDAVGGQKPIQLSIQGTSLAELGKLSQETLAKLSKVPGLVDLDTSLKPNKPTLDIRVRRDAAADLGLNVDTISNALSVLVEGKTVGSWLASDEQNYDIRVSLRPEDRRTAEDLRNLPLVAGADAQGRPRIVKLHQVADIIEGLGPTQINRRDLNREVEITANVTGRSMGEVSADIKAILDKTPWPANYHYRFGGSTKDMKEAFEYAASALGLAIIFIYMILASQFRSFLQPISLMSSLPLTLIGVVLTLLVFGSTLNMFSVIGIIMLMGLVTKNAILLVDFANRARLGHSGDSHDTEPLPRREALLLAARVRLRPILMTTLAMVFGMVPLAFALTEGSEQRAPMGQAVIGGVIASSLLTLVVVPVIYTFLDDFSMWVKNRFKSDKSLSHSGKP
ncbi:MAG: efflux RND transporter permease subunit [Aquabacterium sp.]|uniref:efflux RND transporter permease subunit n=1 Tax=Aquabacterium sp. TaxID=1872578 RepID=UPI0012245574|nr:efflux RND transporter permease subunit [Aquabacterium sp.]TAK97265.1 MAG: efflux RND transporter permease subunit [Aquabacterium sp.]